MKLRQSPFKVDKIENDPKGFGLRRQQITQSIIALYNNRSILITGPRGIGKSSLGTQLQKVLKGDYTLLKRCNLETEPIIKICAFKTCGKHDTLEQIAKDILCDLEREISSTISPNVKLSLGINLGVFTASLEVEKGEGKYPPSTIAGIFTNAIIDSCNKLNVATYDFGFNVMIDEVDKVADEVDLGSFIKSVIDTLTNKGIEGFSFILAGQSGIYSRLIKCNPSFERVVLHVPISNLDKEASEHILYYAASKSKPPFKLDEKAYDIIISLASGYPYNIHLIGNAAFNRMTLPDILTVKNVLSGITDILQGDKKEKYINKLLDLSTNERKVIIALTNYRVSKIPVMIPYQWIRDRFNYETEGSGTIKQILEQLTQKDILKDYLEDGVLYYLFKDELFRAFTSLKRIEKYSLVAKKNFDSQEEPVIESFDRYSQHYYDFNLNEDLTKDDKRLFLAEIESELAKAEYNSEWEDDNLPYMDVD